MFPAPLSSPGGPLPSETGSFVLFGHVLDVRRDPQPPLQTFLLSVPVPSHASMARKHFSPKHFALVWYPDKVLCVDRVMHCRERKFIKMSADSQGGLGFFFVCVAAKKPHSLPL